MTTDEMMRQIDDETAPGRMSQEDALDWLESLRDDIDARIDGLKSDLRR